MSSVTSLTAVRRGGFTALETLLALGLLAGLLYLAFAGTRTIAKSAGDVDAVLDQLQGLQAATTALAREVRESREILFPPPDGSVSRALMLRDFEGRLVSWYYLPQTRELRRAVMDLAGAASETGWVPRQDVEGAYFTARPGGLVGWGLFGAGTVILGGEARSNR